MKINDGKTILFRQRDEKHISKYNFKTNKDGKIDFKVIPYPKYKKVLRKGRKFIKFKSLFLILIIILIVATYFSLTTKRISYLRDKKESTSISTSNEKLVSNEEFKYYSKLIENRIKTLVPLDYEYNIKTETMHKNGSYLYAQGFLKSKENDNLYFDIILKDDKTYSLIINDIDYTKK